MEKNYKKILIILTLAIGIYAGDVVQARAEIKDKSMANIDEKKWDFVKSRSECTKKDVNNEVKITFSEKEEIKEEIIKAANILVNSSDYQEKIRSNAILYMATAFPMGSSTKLIINALSESYKNIIYKD